MNKKSTNTAFAETIALLSEQWHVFQVVFDGHEPEEPGDFTSCLLYTSSCV